MTRSEKALPVQFYLPLTKGIALPKSSALYWQWQTRTAGLSTLWGQYHWVMQSYLRLRKYGFPCTFKREVPKTGIIISHVDHLSRVVPTRDQYIIALLVDRGFASSAANTYITHSELPRRITSEAYWHKTYPMPPWPQINLISRDKERGNRFENIAYIGNLCNLASELQQPSFAIGLQDRNLKWHIPQQAQWNDLSNIDCIVAVRGFQKDAFDFKPALKLINAWAAGIPCILGRESAYREVGRPGLNYLEVTSPQEVLVALERLRDDLELRQRLVVRGWEAYNRSYSTDNVLQRWLYFLEKVLPGNYHNWITRPLSRIGFRTRYKVLNLLKISIKLYRKELSRR